jgi:hypothetical protein
LESENCGYILFGYNRIGYNGTIAIAIVLEAGNYQITSLIIIFTIIFDAVVQY